jgi:hypothetical protein
MTQEPGRWAGASDHICFTKGGTMEKCSLTSKFAEGIRVPSNLDFITNISPDGQAVTIIFSNAVVSIEPARRTRAGVLSNQTALQTKLVTLHLPYSTDQPCVTMSMNLRGFVNAEAGADGRLVACAGDSTTVVDLTHVDQGDFHETVEFTVQTRAAEPVCQITLFLLVEHDTDTDGSGGAQLTVDSLDLEIATPGSGTYQP